jgi:uncharacterized repeat protein (TIGR04138 family)
MPPTEPAKPRKTLEAVVDQVGLYPIDAYEFVKQGLSYTVEKVHGPPKPEIPTAANAPECDEPDESQHVSGRDLCEGLREYALKKWGLLAPTVLSRWNVRRTLDFGKIVFALVDNGLMRKTDEDQLDDFRDVYDFKSAFECGYRIEMKS